MKTQTDNLFKFGKWIKHEYPVGPHKFDYWYNIANCWCFGEKIFRIYPHFSGTDIGLEKEEEWTESPPNLFLLTVSDFRMSVEDAGNEKPVRIFGTFDGAVGRAGELVGEMMATVREIGTMK